MAKNSSQDLDWQRQMKYFSKMEEQKSMKIKIIDILNTIARGETPPKKILFSDIVWKYIDNDYKSISGHWLFDAYIITDILNNEVEILETEITMNKNKIQELRIIQEDDIYDNRLTHNETRRKINQIIEVLNDR